MESQIFTEKQAFAEILEWSKNQPFWQQDALRRLIEDNVLSEEDIDQLTAICLGHSTEYYPIDGTHIDPTGETGSPVSIVKLANPNGINALVNDQELVFAEKGITIVYGDNGAGKSGYVRILKHACTTRDSKFKILPNIAQVADISQGADLFFKRGDDEIHLEWTPDTPKHLDLSSVSIFDSRSASVHVEKTNVVAYTPAPMGVLAALAVICDKIKMRLEIQIQEIEHQTPQFLKNPTFNRDTAVGAYIHQLSHKSQIDQIEIFASLTPEEEKRLLQLESDFAQDPKQLANRINQQKSKLETRIEQIRKLCNAVSDSAFRERDRLKEDWDQKKKAARLASEALFKASPLPDIGKDIWRLLWEAARQYSNEVAYQDKIFPDAEEEDLCVLCLQPLGKEAVKRRGVFEQFVKGTTRNDAERARKRYQEHIDQMRSFLEASTLMRDTVGFIKEDLEDEELAEKIRVIIIRAYWRLRAYLRGLAAPGEQHALPEEQIDNIINHLSQRTATIMAEEDDPEKKQLKIEFFNLKERKELQPILDDVKAEVARKIEIHRLKQAIKQIKKRSVTDKNKEISEKLVTDALRGRFAREVQKLGLDRLPIELRKVQDRDAKSYFQVCLIEKPKESVGDIFSEGEHRCIALAAFLAELVTSRQKSAIIFDDPMSSLDHKHRKAVANRLSEEAKHRQVIVFTHDLAFLYELNRAAEDLQVQVHYQTVEIRDNTPGFIDGDLPLKAKSSLELANSLRSLIKKKKGSFKHLSTTDRTIFSKGIIEQLREAWERGVADFIHPVLQRFDSNIKGNSIFKLAILNEEDVKTVIAARKRLSGDLHSAPLAINPETVSLEDLKKEIKILEDWVRDIKSRQEAAKMPSLLR